MKKSREHRKVSQYLVWFLILVVWFGGGVNTALASNYYDIAKAVGQEISKNKQDSENAFLGYALLLLIVGSAVYIYWESKQSAKKSMARTRKAVSALPQTGQRRQWVRVRANLEVIYRAYRQGKPVSPDIKIAKVKDVSAGGMLLVVPEKLEPSDSIKINCYFEGKKMELKGRVVRSGVEDKSLNTFFAGVKLEDLKEREQDLLARWVLKNQRETIWNEKNPRPTNCLLCGRPLEKGTKRIICPSCSEHEID